MSKKYLLLFILFLLTIALLFPKNLVAVTNHIVISQVQIAGTTATDEFIEIFNPTNQIIDLTGYRLSKKVSSGAQSTLIASMSGTINPDSYLLLGHTNYLGSTTSDKTYSANSVTADNVVILYSDSGTTIVDKVGFGTPFESETLPYSNNPTAGQSIRRINNIDTDNNLIDFELLQVSNPRNSNYATATTTPTASPSGTPSPSPTPTVAPTEVPAETANPTTTPTSSPTIPPPSPTATAGQATPTLKPVDDDDSDDNHHEIHLPFGFKCKFEKYEFKFKKHHFNYFKVSFHRHK